MSFVALIDDYIDDADIKSDMLDGAALMVETHHGMTHQKITTFAPKDVVAKWWTFGNEMVIKPVGCMVNTVYSTTVDGTDLSADQLCFFGGYILGDYDGIDLPVVDYTDSETYLNDLIATSLALVLKENFTLAYVYIQSAYMIMSMYLEKVLEHKSATTPNIGLDAYEL